jgi:hypothetical protein
LNLPAGVKTLHRADSGGGLAKEWEVVQRGVRIAELWMIEDVEEFRTELHLLPLSQGEILK